MPSRRPSPASRPNHDVARPAAGAPPGAAAAVGPRLGLAFGGGLPFGLVALGVLRAIENDGLRIHRLAGTSMGSIIAASYAAGVSIDDCSALFRDSFRKRRVLSILLRDLSFSGSGILRGQEVTRMLEAFVGADLTFEDLRLPLRIPACDLADGSEVVFDSGPVIPAIRASISLPGILAPFHYQGRQLVDGALLRPIPVHLLGNDEVEVKIPVRAVRRRSRTQLHEDLQRARREHRLSSIVRRRGEDLFSVVWRAMSLIMQDEFAEMVFDDFDIYIKPQLDLELSQDTTRLDEIIQAGYEETVRTLPAIRAALEASAAGSPRQRQAESGHDPLSEALDAEFQD